MKRAITVLAVSCLLQFPSGPVAEAQPPDDLQTGIRQVQGGDFDAALLTLDAAARRLAAEGKHPKELGLAYTYLGVAYLQLGQEEAARTKMREAMRTDKDLRLDTKDFPPKIVRFFEEVRAQDIPPAPASTASAVHPPAPAPSPSPTARPVASGTTASKGGHSKALPILLGVGGAAAIGVAVAAKGGGSPPATVPQAPTTLLSQLSASLTSPQKNTNIACTQSLTALVTLTNNGRADVSVSGVRLATNGVSGGCTAAAPATYNPATTTVAAGQTATVLNGSFGASGCCSATSACDGRTFCQLTAEFTVITSLGQVPAGIFGYGVTFNRCAPCTASALDSSCAARPAER